MKSPLPVTSDVMRFLRFTSESPYRKMTKRIRTGLLLIAISICGSAELIAQQVGPGFGAGTEDPKAILHMADQAVRKVRSLTYDATFQGTGSISTYTGENAGTVKLARLSPDNPLKAMLVAQGRAALGQLEEQPFHAAFDGQTISKLRAKDKTLIYKSLRGDDPAERKLGFVTGFFGGPAYSLLMLVYIMDEAFARQLSAPVAEYEGKASINGVLCHVVYLEYELAAIPESRLPKRTIKERWFFGLKDYLPRQFEQITANDRGRYGAYVLSLSNLVVNVPLSPAVFQIRPPKGYTATPYKAPVLPTPLLAIGDLAPDWTLTDAAGKTHTLSEYRGKIVLLDFWATWCGPCIRTMPEIQQLYEKYSRSDLVVLGINCWEESNPAAYMKEQGFTYGLLIKGEGIVKAYHVETLPTIYVIGPDGKILYRSVGAHDDLNAFLTKQFQSQEDR